MLGTWRFLDRQTGMQKREQKMGIRRTYKSSRLEDGLKASIIDDCLSELWPLRNGSNAWPSEATIADNPTNAILIAPWRSLFMVVALYLKLLVRCPRRLVVLRFQFPTKETILGLLRDNDTATSSQISSDLSFFCLTKQLYQPCCWSIQMSLLNL